MVCAVLMAAGPVKASSFLVCRTGLEAETVVCGFKDVTAVGESAEECRGHPGIAEHTGRSTEAEVGSDDHTGLLVDAGQLLRTPISTQLHSFKSGTARLCVSFRDCLTAGQFPNSKDAVREQ